MQKISYTIPPGSTDKSAMGLQLLKDSIMELVRANPQGIRNSDIANALGLRSNFKGGSHNYLTFSVIGLLLSEGKLQRDENLGKARYVAVAR